MQTYKTAKLLVLIFSLFIIFSTLHANPDIISVTMAPPNPGYGDLVNIYIEVCMNVYNQGLLDIAFSSQSTRGL